MPIPGTAITAGVLGEGRVRVEGRVRGGTALALAPPPNASSIPLEDTCNDDISMVR
jgi:hypothetical protein